MNQTVALAFDMFGTLADPASQAEALTGLVAAPETASAVWRQHQLEISWLLSVMERYEDWSAITAYALDVTLQESGIEVSAEERRAVLERASKAIRLYDDVPAALDRLRDAGFELAVLSNGTREELKRILERTAIAAHFAHVISVDEVGVFKPSPRVYLHAADRLGRPVERTWLVSGNPFDCAGAKASGMKVAQLERGRRVSYPFAQLPDLELASLEEFADRMIHPHGDR